MRVNTSAYANGTVVSVERHMHGTAYVTLNLRGKNRIGPELEERECLRVKIRTDLEEVPEINDCIGNVSLRAGQKVLVHIPSIEGVLRGFTDGIEIFVSEDRDRTTAEIGCTSL
ncbi:MAG: hypothetical protein ACHQX1_02205 [Candidatus Micrarchaeales archaeon]